MGGLSMMMRVLRGGLLLSTLLLGTADASPSPSSPSFLRVANLTLSLDANASGNVASFPRLWRTSPKPPDDGLPTFLAADHPLVAALPRWAVPAAQNATVPFTERISLVRLLGGWKDSKGDSDIVASVEGSGANATYTADWEALCARLDGCVSFYCFPPVFVYRARRGARRRNIIFASSRGGGAM